MKKARILLFLASVAAGALITSAAFRPAAMSAVASASGSQQAPQPAPTIASVVDRDISAVEKQIVDASDAMPEDKFNFTPEALNIPGSNYKGVRSFAVQVKHIAASNSFIWSPLTGDKLPEGLKDDGNGPANLQTKGGHYQIPQRLFRSRSQSSCHADRGKHVAITLEQEESRPAARGRNGDESRH
jgi:hypothetical protein